MNDKIDIVKKLVAMTGTGDKQSLAEALGASLSGFSYWNRQQRIPKMRVQQIADTFGISVARIEKLNKPKPKAVVGAIERARKAVKAERAARIKAAR